MVAAAPESEKQESDISITLPPCIRNSYQTFLVD
jgi:hypothetical protein